MIRPMTPADLAPLFAIFRGIAAEGEMLAQDASTSREEFESYWTARGGEQWVVCEDGVVLGGFTLRANHPDRGAHVGTATYLVANGARGKGAGLRLGERSIERARALGFRSMQFNFVVSTNVSAVRLWTRLGFRIVGTLPRAFRRASGELVDAYVMFKDLEEGESHE